MVKLIKLIKRLSNFQICFFRSYFDRLQHCQKQTSQKLRERKKMRNLPSKKLFYSIFSFKDKHDLN